MKQGEICDAHDRYHCIDCGYAWFTVTDTWDIEHVPGTGGEVR
jgi:hypothetical protein